MMILTRVMVAIVGLLFIGSAVVVLPILLLIVIFCATLIVTAQWLWRKWLALVAWYEQMYLDELWQRRHQCEEEARALGALKLPQWPEGGR